MDVPVYLFTGFLESGKSSMMKETLSDPEFNDGSKTLILACEQGEVEFDQKFLKETHSVLVTVEDKEELTADLLHDNMTPDDFNILLASRNVLKVKRNGGNPGSPDSGSQSLSSGATE